MFSQSPGTFLPSAHLARGSCNSVVPEAKYEAKLKGAVSAQKSPGRPPRRDVGVAEKDICEKNIFPNKMRGSFLCPPKINVFF